jgi:hypothetical protein
MDMIKKEEIIRIIEKAIKDPLTLTYLEASRVMDNVTSDDIDNIIRLYLRNLYIKKIKEGVSPEDIIIDLIERSHDYLLSNIALSLSIAMNERFPQDDYILEKFTYNKKPI